MRLSAGRAACDTLVLVPLLFPLLASAGCSARSGTERRPASAARPQVAQAGQPATHATLGTIDPAEAYRRTGFFASTGLVPFVGTVRFLAGPRPDSVVAVVGISLPSRSLTFTRDGQRYRAAYEVEFDLRGYADDGTTRAVGHFRARETVRVSSLRETTRNDESVIFQQLVVVPPGDYTARVIVRDLGSNRTGSAEGAAAAPRFASARSAAATGLRSPPPPTSLALPSLASPVIVYTATPRGSLATIPDLIASARSTAVFGRDSVARVYFEWYAVGAVAPADRAPVVQFVVRSHDDGRELHADSVVAGTWAADGQVAAAIARVPIGKIGLGRRQVVAWRAGGSDTASAALFVSPTDDLAAMSLEELLGYLRYFASAVRLRALSDTTPEARAGVWTAFLRATDPSPATPEHEGLREYFGRLVVANARFRGEDVPGWLSDRGRVYITLGEPDRVAEPPPVSEGREGREGRTRGRAQVWEYAQHRLRLVFVEDEDTRRWSLTPSSGAEFQAVAERARR